MTHSMSANYTTIYHLSLGKVFVGEYNTFPNQFYSLLKLTRAVLLHLQKKNLGNENLNELYLSRCRSIFQYRLLLFLFTKRQDVSISGHCIEATVFVSMITMHFSIVIKAPSRVEWQRTNTDIRNNHLQVLAAGVVVIHVAVQTMHALYFSLCFVCHW